MKDRAGEVWATAASRAMFVVVRSETYASVASHHFLVLDGGPATGWRAGQLACLTEGEGDDSWEAWKELVRLPGGP